MRPEADLAGIDDADLAVGVDEITRMRREVLAAHRFTPTDATVDQRCTFSHGVRSPYPDRLPDSVRIASEACAAREPYTTFILSLPERVEEEGSPAGTWRVRVHAMYQAGFELWDLDLRRAGDGWWEIVSAERTFRIQS